MATRYRYDDDAKRSLRSAITQHRGWDEIRQRLGISSSSLTTELMENVAAMLDPQIDCSLYGKPRDGWGWGRNHTPVAKTVMPSEIEALKQRFDVARPFLSREEGEKFCSIYSTITMKQQGMASEKQRDTMANIVATGETRRNTYLNSTSTIAPINQTQSEPQIMNSTSTPAAAPVTSSVQAALDILAGALAQQQQAQAAVWDEDKLIALIKQHSSTPAAVNINVAFQNHINTATNALAHWKMPLLVSALAAGVNVMLVGSAGTGKTHAVKLAAELLGLGFKFTGAIDSPYKLTGFTDAQGRVVRTPFRDAVENGEVFLQDEADGCLPGALLPINAVASNGICDFPDAIVKAHENFRLVMACNTFGRGSDRLYVGRNAQDAAVLDRYCVISWDVDPALEAGLVGLPRPANAPAPIHIVPIHDAAQQQKLAALWLERVQSVRGKIERHKVRHVVSPRATVMGTKLLCAGWGWADVEEACIFKGLDSDTRAKISA